MISIQQIEQHSTNERNLPIKQCKFEEECGNKSSFEDENKNEILRGIPKKSYFTW